MIRSKTVYIAHDGKEYHSLEKAVSRCEDMVSNFLEKGMNSGHISPRGKIDLIQYVLDNREELRQLLNFSNAAEKID